MSKDKREVSLNQIKNNKRINVILISFKAGNTGERIICPLGAGEILGLPLRLGLNLTACNNVILVDLWWNPALEDQAFDRAHRLGQTRDVNIYKLTIENTVEERILALQNSKRALATAALSGDRLKNLKLGLEDLMALFRPGREEYED
jgi:SNF2 family DNA or RNA helicase